MQHIVELRRPGADLAVTMAQIRTWLDHHRAETRLFEAAFLADRQIRFRLQFQNASDALAFASVLEGEVIGEPDRAGTLAA